jgi:MFS family permease
VGLASVRDGLTRRVGQRLFYGWVMLGAGALGYFASGPAQSHTFSVFITPISEDLDVSRTSVSTAYALATLVAAFGLPYVGRLIDRYGVRRVLLGVGLAFGASAIGFGMVTGMVLLTLGFGALRFLGQGSLMLSNANLVSQWFSRKRGFALSLMSLGFAASMAAHPPLAQWLIDQVGWREAWVWLGVMTWCLLLPVVVLLVQDKPEAVGMHPDGVASTPEERRAAAGERVDRHAADVGLTLKQAMRTPAFWIVAAGLSTLSMLITGLFFHQVSILDTQGLDPQTAASVFSISAVGMVAFMPLLGRLLDRFRTQYLFALALLVTAGALAMMSAVSGVVSAMLYAVVFGLANAAMQTHIAFLWPRFFGRRHLGSIQGAGTTINVVGASLGPLPLAIAFDLNGSYTAALLALTALPIACAAAVLFIREPDLNQKNQKGT